MSKLFPHKCLAVGTAAVLVCTAFAVAPAEAGKRRGAFGDFLKGVGVGIVLKDVIKKGPRVLIQPRIVVKRGYGGSRRPVRVGGRKYKAPAAAATVTLASWKDLIDSYHAKLEDQERDVDDAIANLIASLQNWHEDLRRRAGQRGKSHLAALNDINQLSEAEIKRSLDSAYQNAKLDMFDRFNGELWTRDRLLVRVVRRAETMLEPYFDGVGAKGPNVADIEHVFKASAEHIFARALESNEFLGVSNSYDRYARTVYENTDDSIVEEANDAKTLIASDASYERFVRIVLQDDKAGEPAAVAPKTVGLLAAGGANAAMSSEMTNDNSFAVSYRARRVLFDCLTKGYPSISSGKIGGATIEANASGEQTDRGAKLAGDAPINAAIGGSGEFVPGLRLDERFKDYLDTTCRPEIALLAGGGGGRLMPIPVRAIIEGDKALVDGVVIDVSVAPIE